MPLSRSLYLSKGSNQENNESRRTPFGIQDDKKENVRLNIKDRRPTNIKRDFNTISVLSNPPSSQANSKVHFQYIRP
jgi:hypothetical protein